MKQVIVALLWFLPVAAVGAESGASEAVKGNRPVSVPHHCTGGQVWHPKEGKCACPSKRNAGNCSEPVARAASKRGALQLPPPTHGTTQQPVGAQ